MGSGQSKRDQHSRLSTSQRRWLEEQDPNILAAIIAAHGGTNGLTSNSARANNRLDRLANWQLKQPSQVSRKYKQQAHLYQATKLAESIDFSHTQPLNSSPIYMKPLRPSTSTSPSSTIPLNQQKNLCYATSCQNLYSNEDLNTCFDVRDFSEIEMDTRNFAIQSHDDEGDEENTENHIFSVSTNLPSFHEQQSHFVSAYPYFEPKTSSVLEQSYLAFPSEQRYRNNITNSVTSQRLNNARHKHESASIQQPLRSPQISGATSNAFIPRPFSATGSHIRQTYEDQVGRLNEFAQYDNQPILKLRRRQRQVQQNRFTSSSKLGNPFRPTSSRTIDDKLRTTDKFQMYIQPFEHRGLDYSDEERRKHGLLGILPSAKQDQELQIRWVLNYLDEICANDDLTKYVFLRHLKDYNECLFYSALIQNVEKLMPLVYTPVVGLACQKFSSIFMRPRGLFISIEDLGRVSRILSSWPEKDVRVIVVTDGERILGLGDLGANGMGISIGKLSLYTALAGVPPKNVLPITLDVGTNNETLLADPFYIGLRQKRATGDKYEALLDEFMQACCRRWGPSCLIQFEDFGNRNAFRLLQTYRSRFCTFNDDIQGTASVCLSGLISACKLTDRRLSDCTFLFYGAGEANLGTANLLLMAIQEQASIDASEVRRRIWLVDSKGLVVSSRSDLNEHKRVYAQSGPHLTDLLDIVDLTKPTAIIGASAQRDAFNEAVCRRMAEINERPIIFALSNPTSKAECTAQQAYEWTQGKCVFASGSPFEPVVYNGQTYVTGQGNNAYIFPAVGLATIAAHLHSIPEDTFLVAAQALSDQLTSSDTSVGLVFPKLAKIRECTLNVAARLLEHFYSERLATYRPEPMDKLTFLKGIQYNPTYNKIAHSSDSMTRVSLPSNDDSK